MDLENDNDVLSSCLKRRITNLKNKKREQKKETPHKLFESTVLDLYFGNTDSADNEYKSNIKIPAFNTPI
jgi:hypothetical protein